MTIVRSLALGLLAACTAFPTPDDLIVVQSTSFSERELVGVAVDPVSGTVHVLDANDGVFQLVDDTLVQVASAAVLERDGEDLRPFTDLVALGDDQFAVTVRNDGLLLDLAAQTTEQHFCYLPGSDFMDDAPQPVSQLTHAVAFDPLTDVIFAQPQTFVGPSLDSAQVGTYDRRAGGQPEGWFDLRHEETAATGMVWDIDQLVLGSGSRLSTYTLGDDQPLPYADLTDALGTASLQGMALTANDELVVVTRTEVKVLEGWRP